MRNVNQKLSGRKCSVKTCNNTKRTPNIQFFSFPKQKEFRDVWIGLCNISNPNDSKKYIICGIHFEKGCLFKKKLKNNVIPSLFLCKNIIEDQPRAVSPSIYDFISDSELSENIYPLIGSV